MPDLSEKQTMKIPLQLKCHGCNEPATVRIRLDATSFDWTCPKCKRGHPSFFGTGVTIGFLVLERSRYELVQEQDYSMAIILAAMAFESELSRLFGKWSQIDEEKAGGAFDREECESKMRAFKTIERKIQGASEFLVGRSIDDFVSSCSELRLQIETGYSSVRVGSLAIDIQKHLFWPRNKILHWGDTKSTYDDAARCYSIAQLGLSILRRMDEERRKGMTSN